MAPITVFSFMVKVGKPFKWYILGCFFTSLVWAIDLSLRPYLVKCLIDNIGQGLTLKAAESTVSYYILLYLGLSLGVFVIDSWGEYLWIRFLPHIKKNISTILMKSVLKKSYSFYQNHFSGSLSNNINNCINFVPRLIKTLNESFFRYSLSIFLSVYTLWQVNVKFALGLLLWVAIYLASSFLMAPRVRKLTALSSHEASQGIGYIIDVLSNILNVKSFSQEERETGNINSNFSRLLALFMKRDRLLVRLYILQSGSFIILQALCFKWLLKGFGQHTMTAGDFILVFTISLSIYNCLLGFTKTISDFSENLGIVGQALKVLYTPQEICDKPEAKELEVTRGEVVFENVHFHYKESAALFNNKSVTIQPGQKVGLVGYSGGGKTTFVHLMLRLFDVTSGRILIDGQDIRDVTQASLRKAIGMISQEPVLFHRSLLENIRYAKPEATQEQVQEAASKAHAHSFIAKLPQQYESLVGERGIKLSGGQRQRIAMARAILKNAPILILDEPTSAVDSITENDIQNSLWELMEGKTTLIIAHRLSTLLHMDRILVFDEGKIIQDGSHEELMTKKGLYKDLWEAQVSGFLPAAEAV